MKKSNTMAKSGKRSAKRDENSQGPITIGMDLGDKISRYCVLNKEGEVSKEGSVPTSRKGMRQVFGTLPRVRIALEVGRHSPGVSRWLSE